MDRGKHVVRSNIIDEDLLPGIPLVEIYGQRRVLIENHRGIIEYGNEEIVVRTRCGCICITGKCLKLAKMCKAKLVITGDISAVNLQWSA